MVNSKDQSKSHLLFIDSIRALAALYVVMHHCVLQYYDPAFFPYKQIDSYNLALLSKFILKFFMYGNYAVNLFIVVSGFSLMLSVTKNNFSLKEGNIQFFKRRAFRILPPYYFAMLFSMLLIWLFVGHKTASHWDISIPVNINDVISHIFLTHDFWTSTIYHINHAFWSISVECRIYLFFPLLIFIWKKYGITSLILFSIIVSVAGSLISYNLYKINANIALGPGVSPLIILFTAGMIAADLSFSNRRTAIAIREFYNKLSPLIVIAAILSFLSVTAVLKYFLKIFNDSHFAIIRFDDKVKDVLIGVVFAFILFICAEASKNNYNRWIGKLFTWRPLVFIGTFSYSLYLIHSPLVALISEYLIIPLKMDKLTSVSIMMFFGVPIIIFISYLFFYLFERPFLTMGKKLISAKIEEEIIINPAP